jgi:hypothetical protein
MFTQSEIGAKCGCDAPETVCKEHAWKRYRVPAGVYGELYQSAGYYSAVWWSLRCETCGNRREDIMVYKWHSNGDYTLIDGPMPRHDQPRRYPDIKRAIVGMMPAD